MSGLLDAVGFRDFWTEDQIKDVVARKVDDHIEALHGREHSVDRSALRALLIFSTSKQQTWLVADQYSLHWILDDRRKEEPRIQARTKLSDVEPLKAKDYSPSSGVLYFASRAKGLLFSKNLFQTIDIVDAVRQLLAGADH